MLTMWHMKWTDLSNRVDKPIGHPSFRKSGRCIRRGCISLFAFLVVSSCSSGTEPKGGESSVSDEALSNYRNLLDDVRCAEVDDIAQLTVLCNAWLSLRDSIANAFHDGPHASCPSISDELLAVNDSIVSRLAAIVASNEYTLTDYMNMRLALATLPDKERYRDHIMQGNAFFASLDSVDVLQGDYRSLIGRYIAFLEETQQHGIATQEELEAFLRNEDRYFRSLLVHLCDMNLYPSEQVSDLTAEVVNAISATLDAPGVPFDSDKALVYMIMRSSRRLLANARQCAEDMQGSNIRYDAARASASFWMLLQPFLYMDDTAICMLSDEQAALMLQLSERMPGLLAPLVAHIPAEHFDVGQLSKELIITYLTRIR